MHRSNASSSSGKFSGWGSSSSGHGSSPPNRGSPPGGPPGNSAPRPLSSSGNVPAKPKHLSFIFRVVLLDVDFQKQKPRSTKPPQRWLPPTKSSALDEKESYLFRWKGGNVKHLANDSKIGKLNLKEYKHSAATVFTQYPSTHHLLAVLCDAQIYDDFSRPDAIWIDPSFDHHEAGGQRGIYSYLTILGDEARLAAPMPSHWIDQLLLPVYDYQPSQATLRGPSRPKNAGLIGHLSLLLSLAVFTCPESALVQVLESCVKPGAWGKHSMKFPAGHEKYRGMAITIYYDPENPEWSNEDLLNKLQDGEFGPFYGPSPYKST